MSITAHLVLRPIPTPHLLCYPIGWTDSTNLVGWTMLRCWTFPYLELMIRCRMTCPLSLTVSEEGLDGFHQLSNLLHALSGGSIELLGGELEEFLRLQAKTQQLTLVQQLDNGIRFLDFRIMMEHDGSGNYTNNNSSTINNNSSNNNSRWYSIHFMQSNRPVADYLRELRQWLDEHEHEIIVVWLSKQGDTLATGQDQYPHVSQDDKDAFWQMYTSIMDGLLLDTRDSDIHTTFLSDLIRRGHRVITYCSDHAEFTKTAPHLALDAKRIENTYDANGVFNEPQSLHNHLQYFRNGAAHNKAIHSQSGFTLLAMNTAGTSWQITHAAIRRFLPWLPREIKHNDTNQTLIQSLFKSCASQMNIPGVKKWCPQTLLDIAQLSSYYNQIVLESALTNIMSFDDRVAFPNALYLDALDFNGTVRVGSQLLDGTERDDVTVIDSASSNNNSNTNNTSNDNAAAQYAYVDTILTYNVEQICRKMMRQDSSNATSLHSSLLKGSSTCESLKTELKQRRQQYPLRLWEQPELGRHINWPLQSKGIIPEFIIL